MNEQMNQQNNSDQKLWTYHQTDNVQNLTIGHPRQDMLYKKITKQIKVGKILEIGFGDGYLLSKLSKKYQCYGADISNKNIVQMKEKIMRVSFSLMSIDGKLPYEDNFFDGFIASEVLEHMNGGELNSCVKEIKRVLKPNGIAVITFPVKEKLQDSKCFCPNCKSSFHKWGHKQSWNDEKIQDKFEDFKIIMKKTFFTPYCEGGFVEKLLGRSMWLIRTVFNKIIKIDGASYLVILQK